MDGMNINAGMEIQLIPGSYDWDDSEALDNFFEATMLSSKETLKGIGEIPAMLFMLMKHKKLELYKVCFFIMPFANDEEKLIHVTLAKSFIKTVNMSPNVKIESTIFVTEAYSSKYDTKSKEDMEEIQIS